MTIWLVTIGSSDVELRRQGQQDWRQQFQSLKTSNKERFSNTQGLGALKEAQSRNTNNSSVLMRILGDIYQDSSLIEAKASSNLDFPLLEQFITKLEELEKKESEKVEDLKVFVLLTDQSTLFSSDEKRKSECPYWQDTAQLEPILKWYFKHKLDSSLEPQFLVLKPRAESTEEGSRQKGIDCWNAMLREVRENLNSANIEVKDKETVYVSHQAGTPAISSALQFCSIAKFGDQVQFLVLNREYKDKNMTSTAKLLKSSEYIRAIQIEKAKQLIKQGEPGAALALIRSESNQISVISGLNEIVSQFNVRSTNGNKEQEFEPKKVTVRIKNALEIVKLLFENEKYILGIAILASAHESFLKASIMYAWNKIKEHSEEFPIAIERVDKSSKIQIEDEFDWDVSGLKWKHKKEVGKDGLSEIKTVVYKNIKNSELFKFSKSLLSFKSWSLLDYICGASLNDNRSKNDDIRNQFMHNLRGATKEDVILYISGRSEGEDANLVEIYEKDVVTPFCNALTEIGLWEAANLDDRPSIQDRLDKLVENLDSLA